MMIMNKHKPPTKWQIVCTQQTKMLLIFFLPIISMYCKKGHQICGHTALIVPIKYVNGLLSYVINLTSSSAQIQTWNCKGLHRLMSSVSAFISNYVTHPISYTNQSFKLIKVFAPFVLDTLPDPCSQKSFNFQHNFFFQFHFNSIYSCTK